MAYAFRLDDPRMAYIRISREDIGGEGLAFSLRVGDWEQPLKRAALQKNTLSIVDDLCDVERALQRSRQAQPLLVIRRGGKAEPEHAEAVLFHHSFFAPLVDYCRAFPHCEPTARPETLAVFTHVYDDTAMLRFWEWHHARLVGQRNLFVIDHGSPVSPRLLLHPETNVVRLPRGETDHAEMARFCGGFQRFLLSQYRWVLHTDADELLVHEQGNAALMHLLATPGTQGIFAPGHAVDIIHDQRREGPLRLGEPLGPQRGFMLPNDLYKKPLLASEPASWLQGFHLVFEEARVREVPALWLLHLQSADFELLLRKNRKWNALKQSAADVALCPQNGRPADEESLKAWYAGVLADARLGPIPQELRRLY